MKERTGIITFGGNPLTLVGEETIVGNKAPDFAVLDKDLHEVKLSDFEGKVVILSVFPSIDTPVCSLQTARFNEEAAKLGDDVKILAISADLPFALARHCAAEGIDNALTLSDHRDLDFAHKYGFLIKELRLLSRGAVVIDKEGIIKYVEYVSEVTNEPDYDKALEAADECFCKK